MHKYIHNVTKVMCALYVRCALSVLQKECRKVWGVRYTLGACYRSENTVTDSPVVQNLALACAYHTQEGSRPLNAGCLQLLFNMHTALLRILSLHIMTHYAVIKSGHLNDGLMKSIHWSRGPGNSTKIYRNLPLDMILSLSVITSNTHNLLP